MLLQAQLGSVHWQLPLNCELVFDDTKYSNFFGVTFFLVSVFMFDYVSTIISYSLVGVAIFSGRYDGYTPVQLASAVSKVTIHNKKKGMGYFFFFLPSLRVQNAFFCMYLLNSFSTVVDTAVKFAEIAGFTHRYNVSSVCVCEEKCSPPPHSRVGQLLETLKKLEEERKEVLRNSWRRSESSGDGGGSGGERHRVPVELVAASSSINNKYNDKGTKILYYTTSKKSVLISDFKKPIWVV